MNPSFLVEASVSCIQHCLTLSSVTVLFFPQEVALKHGLLLVDTKYEFGRTSDGTIVLIDEVKYLSSSLIINIILVSADPL